MKCGVDDCNLRSMGDDFELRAPEAGDLGWVVQQHGRLYAEEFGWGVRFEGLVAGIVSTFAKNFDPEYERAWIAVRDGKKVGCVFLVNKESGIAQLRLLIVMPEARGLGLGRTLVRACSDFARAAGYHTLVLWTNTELHSARRIYEAEGYRKIREERHEGFGVDFTGEYWELTL